MGLTNCCKKQNLLTLSSLWSMTERWKEGNFLLFEQVSFETFRSFCWFPVFFRIMAGHPHTTPWSQSDVCCLPRDTGSTKKQLLPLYHILLPMSACADDSTHQYYQTTSIVPVLTLRLYFWDVHENNQTTTFFHSLSLTQLYMTMYIIRKTLMHNKT
jgi:hypothetical protein